MSHEDIFILRSFLFSGQSAAGRFGFPFFGTSMPISLRDTIPRELLWEVHFYASREPETDFARVIVLHLARKAS